MSHGSKDILKNVLLTHVIILITTSQVWKFHRMVRNTKKKNIEEQSMTFL